jgi:site-specific DNA-methyltransferase (adenine-specific)
MNEEYCIWAEKRLQNAENDKSIQGYVDGVFWERNTLNIQQKTAKKKQSENTNGRTSLFA